MERPGETKLWKRSSPARDHLWFDHEADPADNDKHAAGQVDLEHGPAFGNGQRIVKRPGWHTASASSVGALGSHRQSSCLHDRRWGFGWLGGDCWPNRWLSLGLCSECPFPFQTDKSPGVFSNNIPFFKVMGRGARERKAAFSLRVSANSLAWIGQWCGWHSKEGGDTDIYI